MLALDIPLGKPSQNHVHLSRSTMSITSIHRTKKCRDVTVSEQLRINFAPTCNFAEDVFAEWCKIAKAVHGITRSVAKPWYFVVPWVFSNFNVYWGSLFITLQCLVDFSGPLVQYSVVRKRELSSRQSDNSLSQACKKVFNLDLYSIVFLL